MCETTIYCDMSVTILMGKSGKCVKHVSFRIETVGFFSAREGSVCEGSRFICFSVEREEFLLETDQHKTNENLTFMSPVHVHSKERTSNGAYLTRPCAARSTLVYLERGGVPQCTKSVESVNQASWRGKWCPGEVLDPSHKQRCIIGMPDVRYYIFWDNSMQNRVRPGRRKEEN